VLNAQGYTQAAVWNRIPLGAWALMGAIAICSNFLAGFNSQRTDRKLTGCFLFLPLIIATSFLFVSDMDSPRHGVIRVVPQNLISLSHSLSAP
jgi:hypothetical protein